MKYTSLVIINKRCLPFEATSKTLKKHGGHFALMHLQPQIQKVLDIVKALPTVPIFRNEQEMDEYLDAMQKKVLDGDD